MNGLGTLIINAGSSSVKYRLYVGSAVVLDDSIDFFKNKMSFSDVGTYILSQIPASVVISKVAHRVVYGRGFKNHVVVTNKILSELKKSEELSPLHMPHELALISFFMKHTSAKQIACFDTVFHNTMPDIAKTYPIPSRIAKKHSIQRYGFHGLSHQYMMQEAQKQFKKSNKIITCQLGNGISFSAVKSGRCIDTSMGFTPLEGSMMGTRSGSIDPALVAFIAKKEKISADKVIEVLNHESGLKGIAGEADIRVLLKRTDVAAKLAIHMLCYNIKKYIGAYIMALDGLDVLVLGGGIAQNKKIVTHILNTSCMTGVKVLVVKTDEQEIMHDIAKKF